MLEKFLFHIAVAILGLENNLKVFPIETSQAKMVTWLEFLVSL